MRLKAVLVLLLAFFLPNSHAVEAFQEGVDYTRIATPLPVTASPGKVQVHEFFWYGCPHCFNLEPFMTKWLEKKPDYVEFVRVPAGFRPLWQTHARAYYAAEALGVLERVHPALFNAFHRQGRPLMLTNEQELADFFEKHGVARSKFLDAYNSFSVQTKTSRATELTRQSGITGVPAIIIGGKYLVDEGIAGGKERLIEVLDFLVRKEKSGR